MKPRKYKFGRLSVAYPAGCHIRFYFFRTGPPRICEIMSLLPFLRPAKEGTKPATALRGSSSIINEAYKEVSGASCHSKASGKGRRREYQIIPDTKKAIVDKYASEHGVASAVRKFKDKYDKSLNDSTVRDWRNYYNSEVRRL